VWVPDLTFGGLFVATADGRFEDRTIASGVAVSSGQYSGWGAELADLDNDGHLDLFVANGKFHHLFPEHDLVMRGDGQGGFTDVTDSAGAYFQTKRVSRGAALADIDNDGDLDVAIVNNEPGGAPVLLRNDQQADHHWLQLRVLTREGSPEAIGAKVVVEAGGQSWHSEVQRMRSYLSSSDPRVHIGLGTTATVDRVTVTWPGGATQELTDLPADTLIVIHEEQGRIE